ncbi:hypothetical protein KAFR_0A07270 [Kazachstania africana CBS 2517]|uniref:PH domain-containing protein n=1 Tax=Kazachstania africana (strain ATCC 22294 / BCRC 22015 / CBS 2517 / CECT 1963 / NBRC 1671 / NRRL Y-8276) TaxID=1071382 RepID=H2AP61_KAZAF|nr:hypothetical protein KAFR_0A07270 [Kazachstania africana CBS 2517]CCF56161.1 hypothetical protein KAFR_0A07270 [Kazachstania africana CBS 2517]
MHSASSMAFMQNDVYFPVIGKSKTPDSSLLYQTSTESSIPSSLSISRSSSTSSSSTTSLPSETVVDSKLQFLQYVDPLPCIPPSYDEVNPLNRLNLRIPVFDTFEPYSQDDKPPSYEATIHKFAKVKVKLEFQSPYDRLISSFGNKTKDCLLELNSTQLNLYSIPKNLDVSTKELKRYFRDSNLFRSFTLQFGKIGSTVNDTFRKKHTLRCRLENQQFLIEFKDLPDMIKWYRYIHTGIAVSLDLSIREIPNYRIVPRRRRKKKVRAYADESSNKFMKSVRKIFGTKLEIPLQNQHRREIEDLTQSYEDEEELDNEEEEFDDNATLSSQDSGESSHSVKKWNPSYRILPQKKQIDQQLRCIKPFSERYRWFGKIVTVKVSPPNYQTNNQVRNDKNHYLSYYIVTQNGLVNSNSKVFDTWNQLYNGT